MTNPVSVDALFALARDRQEKGADAAAVSLYRQLLCHLPSAFAVWVNLGFLHQRQGRGRAAEQAFRRALTVDPGQTAVMGCLAQLCQARGDGAAAVDWLTDALEADPQSAEMTNNLGNALVAAGRPDAALAAFRRTVVLAPDRSEPLSNLAALLIDLDRPRDALQPAARALRLTPGDARAANNLGAALVEEDRLEEAIAAFHQALHHDPAFADAGTNLSAALMDRGDCQDAEVLCRRLVALRPDHADAYNNLGNALRSLGRLAEADKTFRRALRLSPQDADVHYNASSVFLKSGNFADGWDEFEWRKRTLRSAFRNFPLPGPEWDGQALSGRTLLLYAEQGLGDVLQFIRFVPLAVERAQGPVVLQVYPSLQRLLGQVPGVSVVVSTDDPLPAFDCHLPLMSLPAVLGCAPTAVAVPYLTADTGLVEGWRRRLAPLPGRKVGLCWAGAPRPEQRGAHRMDQRRSLPLAALAGLLGVPGLSWVSLQKGDPAAQLRAVPGAGAIFDAMDDVGDFADTAALASVLDLVVSVDTSVAHLGAALGRPVWLLDRCDGCWRWLAGRDDSPWYPTMRIYHQTAWGDWDPVLRRLAADLALFAAQTA